MLSELSEACLRVNMNSENTKWMGSTSGLVVSVKTMTIKQEARGLYYIHILRPRDCSQHELASLRYYWSPGTVTVVCQSVSVNPLVLRRVEYMRLLLCPAFFSASRYFAHPVNWVKLRSPFLAVFLPCVPVLLQFSRSLRVQLSYKRLVWITVRLLAFSFHYSWNGVLAMTSFGS